jgi:hypothetical protein
MTELLISSGEFPKPVRTIRRSMIEDESQPEFALLVEAHPWRTSRQQKRLAFCSHRVRLVDLPLVEGVSHYQTEVSHGPQDFRRPAGRAFIGPIWLNLVERRGLSSG